MLRSARSLLLFAILLTPLVHGGRAAAQRCVDPADSADDAGQNRYCGASLISGLGGPTGFGTSCLGRNDDGSSSAIDIRPFFPTGLRFFTPTPHNRLFVNTNGNITFSAAVPAFTPSAFPIADQPMIAPFWADVDIRDRVDSSSCSAPGDGVAVMGPACHNPTSNGIWWHMTPGRAVVTWHEVAYFKCRQDRRQSFQLILDAVEVCGMNAGDFNVEFRFNRCEWDTGDASGGQSGFAVQDGRSCTTDANCRSAIFPIPRPPGVCRAGRCEGIAAQAGFDAGNRMDFVEIMGSRESRTINRRLCEESNVGEPGVWRFQLRAGAVQCPEAGTECDTGMQGVCGGGRISCACSGASCTTSCVPQVTPRPERCNQLDDDCDGMVDDESDGALCAAGQRCVDGACVSNCFEGGCPTGFACTASGCVEAACADVTCPPGERCRGGACVDACGGVVCPEPTTCVGGSCVDVCATVSCDECTACRAGSCVTRCDLGGSCGAGESCQASTGRCVPSACVNVTCPAGRVCRAGACVDPCDGAVCPEGEECREGACVMMPPVEVDAGTPGLDAGTPEADAGSSDFDAGSGAVDAGPRRMPPVARNGCCTVAPGAERERQGAPLAFALVVGLGVLVRLRRRKR